MRYIRKLWGWVKSGVKKIAALFAKKNPVEVIEDATKAVVGIASTGTVLFAIVNTIRVALMKGKHFVQRTVAGSGDDLINQRKPGTLDEKLAALNQQTKNFDRKQSTLTQEDLDILADIAKTRNSAFKLLSPEDQKDLLKLEGFDYESYRTKFQDRHRSLIRKSLRKVGEPTVGKPFRDPVDYGWLNFIMRPLDDFLCWLRNDPVPKKVPQIRLLTERDLKDIECSNGEEALEQIRALGTIFNQSDDASNESINLDDERMEAIYAQEVFRHKKYKSYRKAVNARMMDMQSGLTSKQLFDLMAEEEKDKKKKKKKNKKKQKKNAGILASYNPYVSEKGKKKKHKKGGDDDGLKDAQKEAEKMYNHFLKLAATGEIVYNGYHLDRIV